MKITSRRRLLGAAFAAAAQLMMAAEPRPGLPGGPGEYRDFKVVKSYSARDGEHVFHAFAIEWQGQEVIARDVVSQIKARSDDTINVLVSRGVPRPGERLAPIVFLARSEKKPPFTKEQIPEPVIVGELKTARVKVTKVYALDDGEYFFRAYEVEWQGQEVVVHDDLAKTTYAVGDTMTVRVRKWPYPDGSQPHGILSFEIEPDRAASRPKRR